MQGDGKIPKMVVQDKRQFKDWIARKAYIGLLSKKENVSCHPLTRNTILESIYPGSKGNSIVFERQLATTLCDSEPLSWFPTRSPQTNILHER